MLSHQLKQFVIDGKKSFIQNPNDAQKKEVEKIEFEVNEVYAIDVIISTNKAAKVCNCNKNLIQLFKCSFIYHSRDVKWKPKHLFIRELKTLCTILR